jgi:DNA-binding transcriptional ArsR family regulator
MEISMKPNEIQFALNLEALSVPQCRRIVEALVQDSHTLKDLSKLCKLKPASIDKHLEILIEAGLVKVRSAGGEKKAHLQTSKFKPTLDWFKKLTD